MLSDRIQLDGTIRSRAPEQTWQALAPELQPRYGISRVARLTGLDSLRLPVHTAIRPASQTLTVTQGTGATDLLAQVSAVMEAIELWHTEQPLSTHDFGSYREIAPAYPFSALPLKADAPGLERVRLEWTTATGLIRGTGTLVPSDMIRRTAQRDTWQPDILRTTSTGLAAGNSPEEAALHGMFEVIERDALHADDLSGGSHRTLIDPLTVEDPYCAGLIGRLAMAGAALELVHVENAYAIPVCTAYLWSEDYPVWAAGGGCHTDPDIALSRAITEAAQSRLTRIAGTRDDLPADDLFSRPAPSPLPAHSATLTPWGQLTADAPPWHGRFADHARTVARRIEAVTGYEPLCVDLTQPDEQISAVKVICPGARSLTRRAIPR
ncbi:YcaO-like family protein [Streptomyces sp. NBC_00249]|uniref:YcaO-like family protein n=1 Tax=Streptomyces sp. NBC_00249 TaxID=2975690 RepID=UPI00225C0FB6|nr:YcaO-like family protein [Streptomyces sp. NBC_00249]MCX5199723.1 YcaO-like family protein [Streptomyces sp. NBC_00249]